MRRCCPALCIRTAIDATAIDATADISAALVPVPPAAVSRPPLLVLGTVPLSPKSAPQGMSPYSQNCSSGMALHSIGDGPSPPKCPSQMALAVLWALLQPWVVMCHRVGYRGAGFVLAVGSAVFDAMFNGGMATTSTEIELPDVEPAAFLALLKFLYSDEVQIGPETVMTTLYTAKKYAVPALEAHCVEFLKKNLRADNAFMLLTQARLFDEPQLASLCLENIDKNTSDALNAEGFTDIDLDTLVAVLERDTLGIREVRLFNAVVRWSEAECQRQQLQVIPENKRKVLGKALSLIRFPLMTIEEFAAGHFSGQRWHQLSGILTDREVVSLFLHFTVNPKPRVEFIDRPRCCLRGKECSISRFQQVESRWGYSGTSDRIRFSVNKRIFVVGFGLYGSIHGPTDYQVNIQIIHTDSNTVLGQNDTGFSCDGSSNTFRVMFKEPVEILPNVNYTACATLKGPDSHYGTKGLRKVIHESPTTGAKTCFTFCYAAGNNNGTSVEDGQIPEIIFYT
ncbi:hypothetical protein DV515_00016011 [Chloebia gouldiae]|uniref:BTB domain-containing protein n=1 Tax=Chloebia gouldiae TaxID=44316 RepID=A0A3L8RV00_CHLGU|nr:hypothetical protein DV515_00016011 [Chloebia gouldiae]